MDGRLPQFAGVSPPPAIPSPGRNDRAASGLQAIGEWEAGESQVIPLIDATRAESLWRVSVFGEVEIELVYGTRATIRLTAIAPFVSDVPGQLTLSAWPLDPATQTRALATLTPSGAPGLAFARQVIPGPQALPEAAANYFALTASNVTVAGATLPVAVGQWIPVVAGSVLVSGSGLIELGV